jgi:hypothetical protein
MSLGGFPLSSREKCPKCICIRVLLMALMVVIGSLDILKPVSLDCGIGMLLVHIEIGTLWVDIGW